MITKHPYREIEKAIGYRFRDRGLLRQALTQRSYRYESSDIDHDNQRLEFLGDAVLGFLAAEHLYARFPDSEEGVLTQRRSDITSGKALAALGRRLGLGPHLVIGKGDERSGGRHRASTLADAVEAVLGAVYLDGGLKGASRMFRACFTDMLDALADGELSNAKGALQEYCQGELKQSPVYRLLRENGPPHARRFTSEVCVAGVVYGRGEGASKQASETAAAHEALARMHPKSRQ